MSADSSTAQPPDATSPSVERPDLPEAVRALLHLPDAVRIRAVREGTWIPYPGAMRTMAELKYVLEQPPSNRMTGLTLVGPTNNGKTTIIKEFMATHRVRPVNADAARPEFLYVDTPPEPNVSMFCTAILRRINDPKADKGTSAQKLARLLHIVPQLQPRMMFLDEIHNLLAGSSRQSEAFLNTLKTLANQLQLPIVLIGTDDASNVVSTDPQVSSRYPAYQLPAWPWNDQYTHLVKKVLSTLPLRKASNLSKRSIEHLHDRTKGALGALVQVLQRAAVWAIEKHKEEITPEAIEATEIGR